MANSTVIIGGGPAGLAAALECGRQGRPTVLLEMDAVVGGISRTVERNGYRFDIGGHRFFTKSAEVEQLWRATLPGDFLRRPRLSRIYFNKRFFDYPLKPANALLSLGIGQTMASIASYLRYQLRPNRSADSFETWAENQFGRRLYRIFFKAYTEKVWGIPCSEISSEWGVQRIKGLNLASAIRSAVLPGKRGEIKTLIEEFDYPRLGPGQMYEAMMQRCREAGVDVRLGHRATGLEVAGQRAQAVLVRSGSEEYRIGCDAVISSMPLDELVMGMSGVAATARDAAAALTYRSLITVNLMLSRRPPVPDTWIYVHDPSLVVGRVQFYHNWSPAMIPDEASGSMGLEIFASEGDAQWLMPDDELIARAAGEAQQLGLLDRSTIRDAFVVRTRKAYPISRTDYHKHVNVIREAIGQVANVQPIGRYGMFRYNNMDHSILTGMLAARNLSGESNDIWAVNTEEEYHEQR